MDTPIWSDSTEVNTRSGYIALLGFPNVGKSSLLNCLIEQKLSIVTALPQTTRERVVGIDSRDGVQMIFIDTPGLVEPRYLLQSSMLQSAQNAIHDADVTLLLLEPGQPVPDTGQEPFRQLVARSRQVIIVINKSDLADASTIEKTIRSSKDSGFSNVLAVSALEGTQIAELRQRIAELLPVSPFLYPAEEISAQPVRFFVGEFVRESIFELFKNEIPFSVAVRVEEFREATQPVYIRAVVFVERASQKGILIGAGGTAIRRLGEVSRTKIEEFLDERVYLDLWVKVLPRWRKDARSLRHLGYPVPPQNDA